MIGAVGGQDAEGVGRVGVEHEVSRAGVHARLLAYGVAVEEFLVAGIALREGPGDGAHEAVDAHGRRRFHGCGCHGRR